MGACFCQSCGAFSQETTCERCQFKDVKHHVEALHQLLSDSGVRLKMGVLGVCPGISVQKSVRPLSG
ncbi:MAG: hypothetical protein QOJ40_147 [Verrucomicrobiota bacterium]